MPAITVTVRSLIWFGSAATSVVSMMWSGTWRLGENDRLAVAYRDERSTRCRSIFVF